LSHPILYQEDNGNKEFEESDYDKDKDELEEKQKEGNGRTRNDKSGPFYQYDLISKYSTIYHKSNCIYTSGKVKGRDFEGSVR
jgi:hypothetical protein